MKKTTLMLLLNAIAIFPPISLPAQAGSRLLIAYDTKTHRTEKLAEKVKSGAQIFKDVKIEIKKITDIDPNELIQYDALILGSPIHYGNISSNTMIFFEKAINLYGKNIFHNKYAAVFMTGNSGHQSEEALITFQNILTSFGFTLFPQTAISLGEGQALVELNQAKFLGYSMAKLISKENHLFVDDYNLPEAPSPVGNYQAYSLSQNLIYINQIALENKKIEFPGVIEKELTLAQAEVMTKRAMLNILAVLKQALNGDLSKVKRVVQLTGFFLSEANFSKHADLLNIASNLSYQFFGEKGKHARAAIGASSLPLRSPVEIQAIIEIESAKN